MARFELERLSTKILDTRCKIGIKFKIYALTTAINRCPSIKVFDSPSSSPGGTACRQCGHEQIIKKGSRTLMQRIYAYNRRFDFHFVFIL